MRLFDGPIEAVGAIGHDAFGEGLSRQGPQWLWPADRSWFVATEIDFAWTYLDGTEALVDRVLAGLAGPAPVEAVRIRADARW